MSDLDTDGAFAPADDGALFSSVTGSQPLPPEPIIPPTPEPPAPEPAIPPGRLREEAEARRAAERERDELRGRLSAFEQRQQPKEPTPKPDVFENADAFVEDKLQPHSQKFDQMREFYSQRDAVRDHGQEKVTAAFNAMDQALRNGDPDANAAYARAKTSMHPFGDIVAWHSRNQVLAEVGNDAAAYRQRIIDEALKDPEVQKKFLESTRAQAQQNGAHITRPPVSSIPSLGKVGAAALPSGQDEVSDAELFSAATRRKRK